MTAAQRMLSYLPTSLYQNATVMQAVLGALGGEIDDARAMLEDIHDQFFVQTATWGLDRWEDELGLPSKIGTDVERRSRVAARLLGYGTATISKVDEVAEAFANTYVFVDDESTDPSLPDYTTRVTFTSPTGIPPNVAQIEAALREVVPAHLAILYVYNWTLWNEIDAFNRTWDAWDGLNLTWDQMEIVA